MATDDTTTAAPPLTDEEREALHSLQLGIEHVFRAYAAALEWHHRTGHAMARFAQAEDLLREAGHDEYADEIRDRLLPAGAVEDRWTYELVHEFREGFVDEMEAYEAAVRDDLADGVDHVAERAQQREWRDRAETDDWQA